MSNPFPRLMFTLTGLIGSGLAYAQEAAPGAVSASRPDSFRNNSELMQPLALVMISIILLLLFVMLVMGKILQITSEKYVQKMRKDRAGKKMVTTVVLLLS